MRLRSFLLIPLFFLLFSCKKENDTEDFTQTILLNELSVSGNSIVLNWSKVQSKHFVQYAVVRVDLWKKFSGSLYNYDTLAIITDQNTLSYKDNNLADSPDVRYCIIAKIGNGSSPIYSNAQQYLLPKYKILKTSPFDIIQNINKHTLYFFENHYGIVSTYDYVNETIISKTKLDSLIGYGFLYNDGNSKRLIVPTQDKLFLLNENDLTHIDSININKGCYSLVANKSKIIITTVTSYEAGQYSNIQVYDLNTHQKINEIGEDNTITRLFLIPNTSTDLFQVTTNLYSPEFYKIHFNDNAIYSYLNFSGWDDRPIDNVIFSVFPNGKYLITSEEGAIYSSAPAYINKLPLPDKYYTFSDFSINNDCNKIYAAGSYNKSVIEYSFPALSINTKYTTMGFPFKIFLDNEYLIVISTRERTDYYNASLTFSNIFFNDKKYHNEFIVEKIKIK